MTRRKKASFRPFWSTNIRAAGNGGDNGRKGEGDRQHKDKYVHRKALFEPIEPRILLSGTPWEVNPWDFGSFDGDDLTLTLSSNTL